ncbi:MAG: MFS transporter, partial [Sphingomonadaceae bacterium]
LSSVLPPFTLFHAAGFGRAALGVNLVAAAITAVAVLLMAKLFGNWPQWTALGIASYAVFSWSQSLKMRDRPTFALIWGTPTFVMLVLASGLLALTGYAIGFWGAPYAIRTFGLDKAVVGLALGGGGALGGFIGVILGGRLADIFRRRNPGGRILTGFLASLLTAPLIVLQFTTGSFTLFAIAAFLTSVTGSLWLGAAAATTQDLVLPRMRGGATATFFLGTTIIGLGLGPFIVGALSELLGDLGQANIALVGLVPLVAGLLFFVYRRLPAAEASRLDRARAAGEPI